MLTPNIQALQPTLRVSPVLAPKIAAAPSEYDSDPPARRLKQSADEESYVSRLIKPPLSALGYIGSQVDAVLGRRIRAGISLAQGNAKPGSVSELFTVPVVSDLVGWTDRNNTVTGKELLGWDDDNTIWDGVAGFAVEMLTDPLSFTPGLIVGAANRGGRIVRNAGLMPKIAAGLSKKLGRRVGVHEAKTLVNLKDAVRMTAGTTDTKLMSKSTLDTWNAAAKGQGYAGIDDAMNAWGDRLIGGRIGLTWNPVGEARWTFGTGELSQKSLRLVDQAGKYLQATGVGTSLGKMFDSRVRNADTPEMQTRFRESADEFKKLSYSVRLKNMERHAELSLLGLDKPQYRDAIVGSLNKAVEKSQKTGQRDWYLFPDERDIDKIITDNLTAAKHPAAKAPKQWEGYERFKKFLNGVWTETADDMAEFQELGLGNKQLDSTREAYFKRATQPIVETKWYKRNPPTRTTKDMRRVLKKQGLDDAAIDQLPVEDAIQRAYGAKIDDAVRYRAEQEKVGKLERGGSPKAKSLANSDQTEISRLSFLSNIRNGGTSWLADAVMDTRVSGPLADYAQNPAAASRMIYREAMGGDPDALKMLDTSAAERLSHPNAPGVGNTPFQPGQEWGDLAGVGEFGRGKIATNVLTAAEAKRLNRTWVIEKQAFEQSGQIADWLRGLDPRHAFHQIPLFKNDPALLQMEFGLATGRTKAMARLGLKATGDAIDSAITTHELGTPVLRALKQGGYESNGKKRLIAFLKQNAGEIEQDAAFTARRSKDLDLLTTDNPHEKILTGKAAKQAVDVRTSKGFEKVNPKWLAHEIEVAKVMFQYGMKAPQTATRKGGRRLYDMFKRRGEEIAASRSANMPGAPVFLREKDYENLLQTAEAASIKLTPESALTAARRIAYEQFIKNGGDQKVFRVSHDFTTDLVKQMSFTSDPDVTRGFWAGWDKLTNLAKSPLTAQQFAFFTRNGQTLGLMDFIFGAGSGAGTAVTPKRVGQFYRRWKGAYDLHAGKQIGGAHKLPIFSGTDWASEANAAGKKSLSPDVKDELATDMLRRMVSASETIDPNRVGAPIADTLNVHPENVSAIEEMLPGRGANVMSPMTGLRHAGSAIRDFVGKISSGKARDVDWSFLNPLAVRGVTGAPSERRSRFVRAYIGEAANQYSENIGRTATWLGFIQEGVDPVEAARRASALHVDYGDFTNFEKKVMKRAVPFYSYTRRMASYFLRDLAQHPGGTTANIVRAVNNSSGEGRSSGPVPQQLVGKLAIPLYRDGNVQAYLQPDVPASTLNQLFTVGPDAYSTFQNTVLGWIGMSHMLPKFIYETSSGKSSYQKGRNLEDLYSRIGVKDPLTNQIIMSLPLSRDITQFGPRGVLFDERKSLTEKAMSLVAGMPIAHIDQEKAVNETINEAIRRQLRTAEGVSRAERFYVYDSDAADDETKALIDIQNRMSREKMRRNRELKKARERLAKEQSAQTQPAVFMPGQ